jgi:hypothetical protein
VPDPLCIVVHRHRHRHRHTHRHTQTHRHTPTLTMHSSQIEAERVGPIGVVVSPTDSFFVFFIHPSFIFPTRAAAAHILNGCLMKRLLVSIVVSWFVSPSNIGSR